MDPSHPDFMPLLTLLSAMSDSDKLQFLERALRRLAPGVPRGETEVSGLSVEATPEIQRLVEALETFSRTEALHFLDHVLSTLAPDFTRNGGQQRRKDLRRAIYRAVPRYQPKSQDDGDISEEIQRVCEAFHRDPSTLADQQLIRSETLDGDPGNSG